MDIRTNQTQLSTYFSCGCNFWVVCSCTFNFYIYYNHRLSFVWCTLNINQFWYAALKTKPQHTDIFECAIYLYLVWIRLFDCWWSRDSAFQILLHNCNINKNSFKKALMCNVWPNLQQSSYDWSNVSSFIPIINLIIIRMKHQKWISIICLWPNNNF